MIIREGRGGDLGPEDSFRILRAGGGVFKLEISIPGRYPLEPPQMRFLTPAAGRRGGESQNFEDS